MINGMKHSWRCALGLMLTMLVYGCGSGLYSDGYGTYLDANGDVVRAYPANYDRTIRVGAAILEKLDAEVLDQRFDRSETLVEARTPSGSPLRIRYVREGRNLTVVRVRTGQVGYQGREYSNQFHSYLDVKLKRRAKRTAKPKKPASPAPSASESGKTVASANSPRTPPTAEAPKATDDPSRSSTPSEAASISEISEAQDPPKSQEDASPIDPEEGTTARQNDEDFITAKDDSVQSLAKAETTLADISVGSRLQGQQKPDYIVFFEKDSNVPTIEALETLDEAVMEMQANPDAAVELNGYADTQEDPDEFHLVSESRSLAVKSYLIGKGIESHRIHTVWHGSRFSDPSSGDESQNRRVEIRLSRGL